MATTHPNTRAARVRTRYPGVYYRELADGTRSYQICFRANGRLVWKTVPGGERDAVQARAKIVSELGRGKKVAPTRKTFEEFANEWLEAQKSRLGERTYDCYARVLRLHLTPAFGELRLTAITEDRIAVLIRKMQRAGYKPWTIRGVLVPLGRVLSYAVRNGHLAENPVRHLTRDERPKVERQEQRILSSEEIGAFLDNAPANYRTLLATALLSGARQAELLGLTWGDIDREAGVIRISEQLSRMTGQRKKLKTDSARREVVLTRALAQLLAAHRIASEHSGDDDFVFCTASGKPHSATNIIRRGLHKACERAKLREPWPRFHDLRHTYASLLISQGADVVFVSRQLGHASPDITLRVYAHLWGAQAQADRVRDLLDGTLGQAVRGNIGLTVEGSEAKSEEPKIAYLSALGS